MPRAKTQRRSSRSNPKPETEEVAEQSERRKALLLGISYPCVESQIEERGFPEKILINKEPSVDQAVECVLRGIFTEMDGRDYARCIATEQACDWDCYAVSREVGAVYRGDRHMHGDFNARNFVRDMRRAFGDVQFSQVVLDYYWMPTGWLVTRWAKTLFQNTLPDLVKYDMLAFPESEDDRIDPKTGLEIGVIYLPFCAHCTKELVGALKLLKQYFQISFIYKDDLPKHCLWKGTMTIDGFVMQTRLGKRLDQEEIYCTFRKKDIMEMMDDPHINKNDVMRVLNAIENYDDVRMIKLRPLRQHSKAYKNRAKEILEKQLNQTKESDVANEAHEVSASESEDNDVQSSATGSVAGGFPLPAPSGKEEIQELPPPEKGGFVGLNFRKKKRHKKDSSNVKKSTKNLRGDSEGNEEEEDQDSDVDYYSDFSEFDDDDYDDEFYHERKYALEIPPARTLFFPSPAIDLESYMSPKEMEDGDAEWNAFISQCNCYAEAGFTKRSTRRSASRELLSLKDVTATTSKNRKGEGNSSFLTRNPRGDQQKHRIAPHGSIEDDQLVIKIQKKSRQDSIMEGAKNLFDCKNSSRGSARDTLPWLGRDAFGSKDFNCYQLFENVVSNKQRKWRSFDGERRAELKALLVGEDGHVEKRLGDFSSFRVALKLARNQYIPCLTEQDYLALKDLKAKLAEAKESKANSSGEMAIDASVAVRRHELVDRILLWIVHGCDEEYDCDSELGEGIFSFANELVSQGDGAIPVVARVEEIERRVWSWKECGFPFEVNKETNARHIPLGFLADAASVVEPISGLDFLADAATGMEPVSEPIPATDATPRESPKGKKKMGRRPGSRSSPRLKTQANERSSELCSPTIEDTPRVAEVSSLLRRDDAEVSSNSQDSQNDTAKRKGSSRAQRGSRKRRRSTRSEPALEIPGSPNKASDSAASPSEKKLDNAMETKPCRLVSGLDDNLSNVATRGLVTPMSDEAEMPTNPSNNIAANNTFGIEQTRLAIVKLLLSLIGSS